MFFRNGRAIRHVIVTRSSIGLDDDRIELARHILTIALLRENVNRCVELRQREIAPPSGVRFISVTCCSPSGIGSC